MFCHQLYTVLYLLIHQISYTEELKGNRIYTPKALFSTPSSPRNLYLLILPLYLQTVSFTIFFSFFFLIPVKKTSHLQKRRTQSTPSKKHVYQHRPFFFFFFLLCQGPGNWDHKPPAPHLENCLIRWNRLAPSNGSYLLVLSCSSQRSCIGERNGNKKKISITLENDKNPSMLKQQTTYKSFFVQQHFLF